MKTDIDHLLARYFDGLTTSSEEKMIRQYFSQPNPDEHLKEYLPLFRYIENESEALAMLKEVGSECKTALPLKHASSRYWLVAAVAASLLVAFLWLSPDKQSSLMENYVWVDGKRITDPITVREYVELAFERVQPDGNLIEDQIRFVLE